jgi:membrane-bound lytic murein transglycosylase D
MVFCLTTPDAYPIFVGEIVPFFIRLNAVPFRMSATLKKGGARLSNSTRVFVLIFSLLFLIPVYAFADSPAPVQSGAALTATPLYADARAVTVETAPQAIPAKTIPAEARPVSAETKPLPVPADAKAAAATVKQAQPAAASAAPPADQKTSLAAAQAVSAPPPDKLQSIEGHSPTEFLEDGDTELVDADDAETATGEKPPAEIVAAAVDLVKNKDESGNLFSPVEKNIRYFSVTVKNHFARWLERSGKYMAMMKGILRENYLPEDLVFLALIESGFNPKAYSWAKASGPWQFIRGTGQRYGLRVDRWVDERRDPIKSTKAAARYLKDLYGMFGSWPLAMASYNAGEGNVSRAVTRNNGSLDFWELRKTRYLPSETKDYVPKFVAAKMIADNPGEYGFDDVVYDQPFEFDEIELDRCTDLSLVAKCCGVPVEMIKELNPELIRSCTPPNKDTYTLRIPKGKKDAFLAAYNALPDNEKETKPPRIVEHRKRYIARRGDTLKKVAKRFDIPVAELAAANHLNAASRLRKGQRIRIPSTEPEGTGTAVASSKDSGGEAKSSSSRRVSSATGSYKVRKGDTLASIAKKHGMTKTKLAKLNGISSRARVKAGQRLVVSSQPRTASASKDQAEPAKTEASEPKADAASPKATASKKTYRVRRGDTLWGISKKFGVSKDALLKVNSMDDGSSIRKGQTLLIPSEAA